MEAICSSETSVETHLTTRHHIPEDDTLHNHRCENLKSYILMLSSHICLGLPTSFFTSGFAIKTLYDFLSHPCYIRVHPTFLNLIIIIISGLQYKVRSSFLTCGMTDRCRTLLTRHLTGLLGRGTGPLQSFCTGKTLKTRKTP
jgi:hypothetical protein